MALWKEGQLAPLNLHLSQAKFQVESSQWILKQQGIEADFLMAVELCVDISFPGASLW